jgi:16S rRNA (cytidine1402-2'-O)-methyltransferase
VPVFPVPGPAAFIAAVVASGFPMQPASFNGFLPPKSSARRRELEKLRSSAQTEIFYEAPHRIREALEDVAEILGAERRVVIARELTKIHEEFLRGTAQEVLEILQQRGEVKGEIVLLIGAAAEGADQVATISIRDRVEQIMRDEKLDEKAALKKVAKERGISKSEAYRQLQPPK